MIVIRGEIRAIEDDSIQCNTIPVVLLNLKRQYEVYNHAGELHYGRCVLCFRLLIGLKFVQ